MSKFKPGQSGNPKGKPAGAISKKTEQWNQLGEFIINEGAKKYMDYLSKLKAKDYAERFERILEYFKPKQMRTEIKGEITTGPKKIGFEE